MQKEKVFAGSAMPSFVMLFDEFAPASFSEPPYIMTAKSKVKSFLI
jgi:hypothetical protein